MWDSRLESSIIAPAFEQLPSLYTALSLAGAPWTVADRQQFLTLARKRIEQKKSRHQRLADAEWATLRYQLARSDMFSIEQEIPVSSQKPSDPLLAETRHLMGREKWVMRTIQELPTKKLLILQGPIGVGKSSELHRLARHFLQAIQPTFQVVWVPLLPIERGGDAESALDVLLATLLAESGIPSLPTIYASLSERIAYTLIHLQHSPQPTVILLDNAECLLTDRGVLASCWEQFLTQFLQNEHQATLVLATKEWPGWSGREGIFITETTVPSLSIPASIQLLQHLGLDMVPVEYLLQASERVGGNPLCLEWIAKLVQQPVSFDDWSRFDLNEHPNLQEDTECNKTQRLVSLLEEPDLLRGHLATKLHPLLQHLIEKRLSSEARTLLNVLALANIPLGKPALQVICSQPSLLKELRDTSLLIAYPNRIQLLPMVASTIQQQLTPDQTHEMEIHLIDALTRWLHEGNIRIQEGGNIVTELAALLLNHHRLLDTAQLLIHCGWLSFNLGYAPRLAHLTIKVLENFNWHSFEEDEYGGLLLHYILSPYLAKPIDTKTRLVNYQRMYNAALDGKIVFHSITEGHIVNNLMLYHMNELRFEEAQILLETCCSRLEPLQRDNLELQASLLEKRAWLFGKWCEYSQEQGHLQKAKEFREQATFFYRQCSMLLSTHEEASLMESNLLKRRLARAFNNLSYHLYRANLFEEALRTIEPAIELREQGYAEVVALAVSYSQKAEILVELGRFQEALIFDEKALNEIQKWAKTGHTLSQEEVWTYRVNRGKLYLRLGRLDEAEQLLREVLPHIHARRRVYRMFAENALEEIEQWRRQTTSSSYQLDWRWVERVRELDAFDTYWWWAPAGTFNEEEQCQWSQSYSTKLDADTRKKLATLIAESRERELATAIAEHREPQLRYPALDIENVRLRISSLLQLDAEITQEEPNAIVRRLYHDKIEEEIEFLRMIEATYMGESEQFRQLSQRIYPEPTPEEIRYVLSHVWNEVQQGLHNPETNEVSQHLIQFMREHLHLTQNLSHNILDTHDTQQASTMFSSQAQQMVSAEAAKRFFETALRESGYEGWQIVIDKASTTRVESGLRRFILADNQMPVERVRYYLVHELGGHVARAIAGERSRFGLLGIGTKNYAPTEEGLALYHERQIAKIQGHVVSDWGALLGTLSTGLASGVVTPPQTFLSLFTFLEYFFLLRRLLKHQDKDLLTAQKLARKAALANCLRTYRGVPNLEYKGICLTKDAIYLRGLTTIERAVAQDATILDQLAIGKLGIEYLPDMQELGIIASPQPLSRLAYRPDLYAYILSFETTGI